MDKILCTSPYMQQKHGRSEHFESWQLVLWYFLHPGFFGVAKRARADRTNPGQCHSWTLVEPSVYQLCLGYICSISHFWYPQKIWIGPAVQCRKREGLWKRCLQSGTDPTDPQGRGGMFAGPWGGGHPVWMLYKVLQELEKGRFHPLRNSTEECLDRSKWGKKHNEYVYGRDLLFYRMRIPKHSYKWMYQQKYFKELGKSESEAMGSCMSIYDDLFIQR